MEQASSRKRLRRASEKAIATGAQIATTGLPNGASVVVTAEGLMQRCLKWDALLATPITPEDPLLFDLQKRMVYRRSSQSAWPMGPEPRSSFEANAARLVEFQREDSRSTIEADTPPVSLRRPVFSATDYQSLLEGRRS
jgi:hypothetical protein